ncbi:MAG TPA: SDR family NAD(P)-dependent oxidoreductase, partial [Acidimicrobiia bacterium]
MELLAGKVAVVTGAGGGIGRGHAQMLASEGARVVVNDLDGDQAAATVSRIGDEGGTATPSAHDVATWSGGGALVQHAIETYGRLDILVNNAGI